MRTRWRERPSRHSRAGFSIIEAVMVLLIVVVVVGTLTPSVQRQLTRSRINRAARVAAADFYLAQALSNRERQPVTVRFDPVAKTAVIRVSSPDTVLSRRFYGSEGEFKLQEVSAVPASVVVLPNGMASSTITVSLGDGTYTRRVRMSRAGQILVLR